MPKKITITAEYGLGQPVYLKTDPEQHERLIKAITIYTTGIVYTLACGTEITEHEEMELTDTRQL